MSAKPPLKIFTLPLFPLNLVLFPQFPLQLHIFEERYKVMINGCIERDEPFGVVLIREGEEVGAPATPCDLGCTARILAVRQLEDGRMHLLTVGETRFRLLDYIEADLPYLIGRAEVVEDQDTAADEPPQNLRDVKAVFLRYLKLLAAQAGLPLAEIELPEDAPTLSFCIASVTQLPLTDKQRLLEIESAATRLEEEERLLNAQIGELEALAVSDTPLEDGLTSSADTDEKGIEPVDMQTEHWRKYLENSRN